MSNDSPSCFICKTPSFVLEFSGRTVDGHRFFRCPQCHIVVARPLSSSQGMDYSDYGDYLVDASNVEVHLQKTRKSAKALLTKYRGAGKKLLDYGAGAGFFVKAAADLGFLASGVEPSVKLRTFAEDHLDTRLQVHVDEAGGGFDVITLFDVVEHLPEAHQRALMSDLVLRLKPGGVLLGNTPNWRSANRILRAEKDPAIWPPSHITHFTPGNLDRYFDSLGLKKLKVYTKGFRTFRSNKREHSFLEKPNNSLLMKWGVIFPLRVTLRLFSYMCSPFGLGYQIYFEYKKH